MNANYLTLIQFVEIHIEFRNNNHLEHIEVVAVVAVVAVDKEHIEAVEETKGYAEAAEAADIKVEADIAEVAN
jgi:uncharacterized protein involved in high-affinity Fe2+ transport